MDIAEEILGTNDVEDVEWLCSLSESELDFLISLKLLVQQRAKVIDHDVLAKKFNLKVLRSIGFILMEYLKGQMKDVQDVPYLTKVNSLLSSSNLLNNNVRGSLSMAELKECICIKSRKSVKSKS